MLGAYGGDPSTARGFTCTAWATDIRMTRTGAAAALAEGAVFVKP